MSQTWYSLYWPATDSAPITAAFEAVLAGQGYQPFDPFPGGTGTPPALREAVKLFVAPPREGWVQVLGQPPDSCLPDIGQRAGLPALYAWLTEQDSGVALFRDGQRLDDLDALEPYLRPGTSLDQLRQAAAGKVAVPVVESDTPPVAILGAEALPPDVRRLAQEKGVDSKHANKLVEKLGGRLFGKLSKQPGESGAEQDQARALLMGGGKDMWNSLNGQRLRAIASILNLPDHWRDPTWEDVRDAYQVFRLRQRSPRMALMPGDKEAMHAVPDALDYRPVYWGLK